MRSLTFSPILLLLSLPAFGQSTAQYLNPQNVAPATGYSHAVVVPAAKVVYLAGQVGLDPKGELVGKDDFRAQATQAFENLKAVLAAAGTSADRLIRLNYYVVGLDDEKLKTLREVRNKYINTKQPPASTLIGVQRLARDGFQIEVEAIALVP
jgi:enamine deaminase RidA (YjgF/YER057c/UK114 family)